MSNSPVLKKTVFFHIVSALTVCPGQSDIYTHNQLAIVIIEGDHTSQVIKDVLIPNDPAQVNQFIADYNESYGVELEVLYDCRTPECFAGGIKLPACFNPGKPTYTWAN